MEIGMKLKKLSTCSTHTRTVGNRVMYLYQKLYFCVIALILASFVLCIGSLNAMQRVNERADEGRGVQELRVAHT